MRLSVGSKVSYPYQGPCLIGAVVTKVIDGERTDFHHFIPLGQGGAELFVPFGHAPEGVRRLLDESGIVAVLARLRQPAAAAVNGKQRSTDNLKLLASGSALDLAELIASLTTLRGLNRLTSNDGATLERARRMLVREIAEVTGAGEQAAEERIDAALAESCAQAKSSEKPRLRRKAGNR
jgi:RNA polymerase-interacting CarD/CdnL/TRCF family regulator